jgi:hypothetical protein
MLRKVFAQRIDQMSGGLLCRPDYPTALGRDLDRDLAAMPAAAQPLERVISVLE